MHTNLTDDSSDFPTEFHGARLGMSAGAVRDAFPRSLDVDLSDELALHWQAGDSSGASLQDAVLGVVSSVRFEFHLGLLVAVRATGPLSARTGGRPQQLSLSDAALWRVADDSQGHVSLHWISRDCPTHAEEVRRLTAN